MIRYLEKSEFGGKAPLAGSVSGRIGNLTETDYRAPY